MSEGGPAIITLTVIVDDDETAPGDTPHKIVGLDLLADNTPTSRAWFASAPIDSGPAEWAALLNDHRSDIADWAGRYASPADVETALQRIIAL